MFRPAQAPVKRGGKLASGLACPHVALAFPEPRGAGLAAIGAILGTAFPLARALTEPWQ
jgi:hypothetical protein